MFYEEVSLNWLSQKNQQSRYKTTIVPFLVSIVQCTFPNIRLESLYISKELITHSIDIYKKYLLPNFSQKIVSSGMVNNFSSIREQAIYKGEKKEENLSDDLSSSCQMYRCFGDRSWFWSLWRHNGEKFMYIRNWVPAAVF